MFHLVSLSLQISLTFAWLSPWPVCVGCCCCLFGWVGFWFLSLGKFVFNHKLTPVVDRPSLALVRQCRKKKAGSFARPSSPRAPLPVSPLVSLTRYGMVGTAAGDGAPRSLSDFRSSGVCWTRPFSFSDSSLDRLRPFWLLLFHPALPFFVSLALRYWLTLLLHSPLFHINHFHLGTTGIIRH